MPLTKSLLWLNESFTHMYYLRVKILTEIAGNNYFLVNWVTGYVHVINIIISWLLCIWAAICDRNYRTRYMNIYTWLCWLWLDCNTLTSDSKWSSKVLSGVAVNFILRNFGNCLLHMTLVMLLILHWGHCPILLYTACCCWPSSYSNAIQLQVSFYCDAILKTAVSDPLPCPFCEIVIMTCMSVETRNHVLTLLDVIKRRL